MKPRKELTAREAKNIAKHFVSKSNEQLEWLLQGPATAYASLAVLELRRRKEKEQTT